MAGAVRLSRSGLQLRRPSAISQRRIHAGWLDADGFVRRSRSRPVESGAESPFAAASLYVVGGTKLDSDLLADLPAPAGSRVYLYRNSTADFDPQSLTGTAAGTKGGARKTGNEASGIVYVTSRREDSELRNMVERLILLAAEQVDLEAVRLAMPALSAAAATRKHDAETGPLADRVASFERATVLEELERHQRHVTNTAKALGIERSHLYKKCQQLGIDLKTP